MTTSPDATPSLRLLRDPVHLLAFGFGAGLSPVAPGTAGSVVGLVLAFALQSLGTVPLVLAALAAALGGIAICGASARRLGVHDHPAIVWDEIAGMLIAMSGAAHTLSSAALAFALFRLFDIWKPWPIREVDHGMRGGLGIILDDVLAGMLAALGTMLLRILV